MTMTAGVNDKYTALIEDGLVSAQRWGAPVNIGSITVPLADNQVPSSWWMAACPSRGFEAR